MKNNKCPGLDGFSVNFYKKLWGRLNKPLLKLHEKSLEEKELNGTAHQGVISLLDKPQKDLLHIENWRPLTMLDYDYNMQKLSRIG